MNRKKLYIMMLLKYLFCLVFPLGAVSLHGMADGYLQTAFLEMLIIAAITNVFCGYKTWLGYLINVVCLVVMNAQFAVLFWGNTFTSMVMLNNLDSLQGLSGKVVQYGVTVALVLLFTLMPVWHVPLEKKKRWIPTVTGIVLGGVVFATGLFEYSPYYGLYQLGQQQILRRRAESTAASVGMEAEAFQKEEVTDYLAKPVNLAETPNVILIFVEGLSQNILEDEREVVPNLRALESESIHFTNYYNHTFATYMGLSGQLYSGYQENVYDPNYLVSLQDVFKMYGYQTTFINVEPYNQDFKDYLNRFGFDQVITDEDSSDKVAEGFSDKAAYELLLETALEQEACGVPFFLSMYSFGTHVTFDGVNEIYGDGSDALMNRFYDLDVQLGKFVAAFKESSLSENTVLIVTTDHATYQDSDFVVSYPNYQRASVMADRIPFIIYYEGVEPTEYDVEGRNSLDLPPTILDFLDMTSENCFLGESLFSPTDNESPYDTYFESMGIYYDTAKGEIRSLTLQELREMELKVAQYYAVKLNEEATAVETDDEVHIYAGINGAGETIEIEVCNVADWEKLHYAIWSEIDDQDDLRWYVVSVKTDEANVYTVDLADFDAIGTYYIHVYGEATEGLTFLAENQVTVSVR